MPLPDKSHESPVLSRAKKTLIKANNSGLFSKVKSPNNDSMIQSKIHSKSKEIFIQDPNSNSEEKFF